MIIFIIYYVHCIITEIFFTRFFFFGLSSMKNYYLFTILWCYFLFLAGRCNTYSASTWNFLKYQILLLFIQILRCIFGIWGRHPSPPWANLCEFISSSSKFIRRKFAIFLELVGLWWRIHHLWASHNNFVSLIFNVVEHFVFS